MFKTFLSLLSGHASYMTDNVLIVPFSNRNGKIKEKYKNVAEIDSDDGTCTRGMWQK